MKRYWDTSAIIDALHDARVEALARLPGQVTRSHTLAEAFSTLTGGRLGFQYLAADAADMIKEITSGFEFVELSATEIQTALARAQKAGVRGGRVHDWLHAVAAKKANAAELLTDNLTDFAGLADGCKIVKP
jgi:predicted nucleic acid-binding protein